MIADIYLYEGFTSGPISEVAEQEGRQASQP